MLQVELRVVGGKHHNKVIALTSSKFLIGREQDCHLRPNSELVSRHHCVFSVDSHTAFVRDLGSTNGTFVNGDRVRGKMELKNGDHVSVGKLEFEVSINRSAATARPQMPAESAAAAESADAVETVPEETADTVSLGTGDTSHELPVAEPDEAVGGDTTIISMPTLESMQQSMNPQPAHGQPQQPMPGYPMPGYPQYPQYPQYMQPGMPYPPMPGYMPMGGYPPPPMMPPEGQPEQPTQQPEAGSSEEPPPVRLPDPNQTGLKEEGGGSGGGGGGDEEKPSNSAADIIRQYMNRRPGS